MTRTLARRAGFTLLEILIGLGIVIAVAAIAVPWTMGWLGTRELDNAEGRTPVVSSANAEYSRLMTGSCLRSSPRLTCPR